MLSEWPRNVATWTSSRRATLCFGAMVDCAPEQESERSASPGNASLPGLGPDGPFDRPLDGQATRRESPGRGRIIQAVSSHACQRRMVFRKKMSTASRSEPLAGSPFLCTHLGTRAHLSQHVTSAALAPRAICRIAIPARGRHMLGEGSGKASAGATRCRSCTSGPIALDAHSHFGCPMHTSFFARACRASRQRWSHEAFFFEWAESVFANSSEGSASEFVASSAHHLAGDGGERPSRM